MVKITIDLGDVETEHLMNEIKRRKAEETLPPEFEWEFKLKDIDRADLLEELHWEHEITLFASPGELLESMTDKGIPDGVFQAFRQWAESPDAHLEWKGG